jgi:hypothetical protein
MADEKILVEIVLDDGSVQKGFARIQKEAAATEKKVTSDFQSIGENINQVGVEGFITRLRAIPSQFAVITAAAVATGAALKEAFDLALAGERLIAINAQFDRLTQSVGISANALRQGFEGAAAGLVDVDEVIQRANSAIINLGSSAQRLPEILELSRRVTAALGGDIQERFDGIVRAIESANSRALRQQGIVLDTDAALKEYAKTLGVAVNELTLAQRQQAVLNAVIEQGGEQYKNITTSIQPLTDSTSRLKTAFNELGDAIALLTRNTLGEFFITITKGAAVAVNDLAGAVNRLATGPSPAEKFKELDQVSAQLKAVQNQVDTLGKFADIPLLGQLERLKERVQELRSELTATNNVKLDITKEVPTNLLTPEQVAAEQARQAQIDAIRLQGTQFRIQTLQAELQQTQDLQAQEDLRNQIRDEQIKLAAETLKADLLAINQKYSDELGFSDEQREQARLARVQNFNAQIELLNKQSNNKQLQAMIELQQKLRSVTISGLSQTAAGIGAALARGENAFKAFADGAVGIVADLIITIGNALIQQGIAIEFFAQAINAPLPGAGLTAAAKGLALVLFGSALKTAVGSRGTGLTTPPTPVVTTTPTGEFTPSPTAPTELTPTSEVARVPETSVIVNIQGDILDSDETGSRIVSLINDAFDKKGVQVRRGVTA